MNAILRDSMMGPDILMSGSDQIMCAGRKRRCVILESLSPSGPDL